MGAGFNMRARSDEADIYVYEDIGENWFGGVSAKQFASDLKGLGDVKTINLHVNSYGGQVFDGMAMYRLLVDHPAKVIVHVDGVAASAAATLVMAGDEIRITEAGMIMIHNASGCCCGDARDMRQLADLLETITATIADVYAGRTRQSKDDIAAWMDATTWMTAAEAVERGFADNIVANLRVAASAGDPRELYAQRPQPKPQNAAAMIAAANEAGNLRLEAVEPSRPSRSSEDPLRARLALQRAKIGAHTTRSAA